MIVMKFGGTSVGSAERIKTVANIVSSYIKKGEKIVVVVSAMTSVTDRLILCANYAENNNKADYLKNYQILKDLHIKTTKSLGLSKNNEKKLLDTIDNYFKDLKNILESVYSLRELSNRSLDLISSFGERLTIYLLSEAIKTLGIKAQPLEATDLIVTDDNFGDANPLYKDSTKKIKRIIPKLLSDQVIPVITGFIGATKNRKITTLGRGGSDFSATIVGYCLDAKEVWIWTDVDGVMTADPKIIKDAKTIKSISYDEAAELSYFGAKVLHPRTIIPAELKNIPLRIKNTFNPKFEGTLITNNKNGNGKGVKAITTIKYLVLVTLQGKGMIGIPGTAAKLFSTLAEEKINVIFISQASSEHNISFVIKKEDGHKTKNILNKAFQLELLNKRIEAIFMEDDVVILAVVGAGMKGRPGIAGKIFSALGDKNVNIIAIAQGSSELNISLVLKSTDLGKAVRNIHHAFNLGS